MVACKTAVGSAAVILNLRKVKQGNFIVAIKFSKYSGNYFIDFSNGEHYIVSVKVTVEVAQGIARDLNLMITEG